MPAMIVGIDRAFEEQLRQSHLLGDEQITTVERCHQPLTHHRITDPTEDNTPPPLVVRPIAIKINNPHVHLPYHHSNTTSTTSGIGNDSKHCMHSIQQSISPQSTCSSRTFAISTSFPSRRAASNDQAR